MLFCFVLLDINIVKNKNKIIVMVAPEVASQVAHHVAPEVAPEVAPRCEPKWGK